MRDLRAIGPYPGELVVLRPWLLADLDAVRQAAEDPYIPQITTVPAVFSAEAGAAWLHRQWDKARAGRGCPLAVVDRAGGRAVGMAILDQIDWARGTASVGYWLVPAARGRGLVKAAVAVLLHVAGELGLRQVWAQVEPGNTASLAVCRALGFTEEGLTPGGFQGRDVLRLSRSTGLDNR
ncbi:GNAT family protein [Kutzneria viridogrisea]|uniref:N-acetyltransferase domain-containing protein n=2 Tax=Kutzneria TaxID=43356 RepID=W5W4L6_9PSEU|nr:GNAT family N-acetyltransferase [Kutzneria albida]AHH96163.1 hypothetical protein KALB_2795 [Kutzneria albida DSM 43870]MBA8928625.1 RimJ/RimL family protein N-acetyltransferase [Kutzneria viridogrisea]